MTKAIYINRKIIQDSGYVHYCSLTFYAITLVKFWLKFLIKQLHEVSTWFCYDVLIEWHILIIF